MTKPLKVLDVDEGIPEEIPVYESDHILEDYIINNFSHVAAYHACDGRNLSRIKDEGIMPLDASRLRQEAIRLFRDVEPEKIQKVVEEIEQMHINGWYENTIGVFVSAKGSLVTPWLQYPWFVWRLSSRVYDNSCKAYKFLQEYSRGANPTFIRCVFPIKWIYEHIHPWDELFQIYAECMKDCSTNGYDDLMRHLYNIKSIVPPKYISRLISLREETTTKEKRTP